MTAKLALLTLVLALAGCAGHPPMPPPGDLFRDALFEPPRMSIDPAAPLAPSPAMRAFIGRNLAGATAPSEARRQLVEALRRGGLKIDYDASVTRTASEAFDARSGNCLALVLMTASIARELGLEVHYQAVIGEDAWDRAGDLTLTVGHVNLRLEDRPAALQGGWSRSAATVIDFLPPADAARLETRPIDEATVIAMYMNNRSVENLAEGRVDDAYWWARAALRQDPEFSSAYVTLGVIYRRHHHPELAEAALERVTERSPDDVAALSNRVLALRDLGRRPEADALAERVARLDPDPPYSFFERGMDALRRGQPETARRLFTRELQRAPYHAEFEYWLAVTYGQLGDPARAAQHLQRAVEGSTTRGDRQLYAAKLERLKAMQRQ